MRLFVGLLFLLSGPAWSKQVGSDKPKCRFEKAPGAYDPAPHLMMKFSDKVCDKPTGLCTHVVVCGSERRVVVCPAAGDRCADDVETCMAKELPSKVDSKPGKG